MDTSEDDKRIHDALIACCNYVHRENARLVIDRDSVQWFAGVERGGVTLTDVSADSPEGAVLALARELPA